MISRWRRIRLKHVAIAVITLFVLNYFGAFTHVFEEDFYTKFRYPLEGDIPYFVNQVRHNHQPDVPPLNTYNFSLLYNPSEKCTKKDDGSDQTPPEVVFLVKSAISHFKRRNAIRSSWGYERRFSDVVMRTVFLLGVTSGDNANEHQSLVDIEAGNFGDIVQAQFVDTYFNNTLKTMSGIRWAAEFCRSARYFMFVDDDYFVSAKNILRYLKNPVRYPHYIEDAEEIIRQLARKLTENRNSSTFTEAMQIQEIEDVLETQSANGHHSVDSRKYMAVIQSRYEELKSAPRLPTAIGVKESVQELKQRKLLSSDGAEEAVLFAGFVIQSAPQRHKSSKWHVSLEEYPFHMWPPYISAGSYIMSREALLQIYYTSWFTKTFR